MTPEKIYIVNDDLNIKREWYKTKQVGFETTEYTRTDAFIKKACEWLKKNAADYVVHHWNETELDTMSLVEDFKNYINKYEEETILKKNKL